MRSAISHGWRSGLLARALFRSDRGNCSMRCMEYPTLLHRWFIHVTIEDFVEHGNKVAARWTTSMTHRGDYLELPASGKTVTVTGMSFARIAQGKIVEGWNSWDMLAMRQQIGGTPLNRITAREEPPTRTAGSRDQMASPGRRSCHASRAPECPCRGRQKGRLQECPNTH